jgi:hypothetical protein
VRVALLVVAAIAAVAVVALIVVMLGRGGDGDGAVAGDGASDTAAEDAESVAAATIPDGQRATASSDDPVAEEEDRAVLEQLHAPAASTLAPAALIRIESELAGLTALVEPAAAEREQMRATVGPPQAFELTFELDPNDPAGPLLRVETWSYYDLLTAFVFVDGELWNSFPLEEPGEIAVFPVQYDPADFRRDMMLGELTAALNGATPERVSELTADEIGADIEVFAGDQIVLMFERGGLAAVMTVPLVGDPDGE